MAPIHNMENSSSSSKSSFTSHKSSSSRGEPSMSSRAGRDFNHDSSSWESFLPVRRRGRFFQDSFFENSRSHFDDAIRDALRGWGDDDTDFMSDSWHDTASPRLSNLSRYREMRNRRSFDNDDNLAVTVTSDNSIHKIVLDVHDFMEGDLKVKVVGDRELLVEGCSEKSKEGGASSHSSQTFSRRFKLPEEVDVSAIDSVMSSDGILTITAPKTKRLGNCGSGGGGGSHDGMRCSLGRLRDERESCSCDKCNPKLRTRENCQRESSERSQSSTNMNDGSESLSHKMSSSKMDVPIRAFFNSRPITKRGRFFDDAFFADTRSGYRTAIQDILSKWGEDRSNTDDLSSYRNLRTRDLREENQAVKSIEDEFQYKFIVDVHDFMDKGEINVKAVDDRELVVEGQLTEGGNCKRFSRRFTLPPDVHLESVSSVISSDGVLTVIAPKKSAISKNNNTSTLENNSEIHDKMASCNIQSSSENKTYEKTSMVDTKCSNLEQDDTIHKNPPCSSNIEENSNVQSSISSKVFNTQSEEEIKSRGDNAVSIHIESAEETVTDKNADNQESRIEDSGNDQKHFKETITEEFYSNERNARGNSSDGTESEHHRGHSSILDADMRSTQERDMEAHDRRSGSFRLDRDMESCDRRSGSVRLDAETESRGQRAGSVRFDIDEEDDCPMQAEKRKHHLLQEVDKFLGDEGIDRRSRSRERSYGGEDLMDDDDRRTPSRDTRKKTNLAPLNPEAKRVLPISVKGHFCSDAFFNDFQESFKTAISDVLLKFNEKSGKGDDVTAYRNLRLRDPKLENQAANIQDEEGVHKVVLDVKDFLNGEIEAAVYDERELVIEGHVERRTGTSITKLTFLRRFPLPENADTDAITVVMSSDGVLTVVTPWKGYSGLSAIKNILSTEDRSGFDRRRDMMMDWEDPRESDEDFMTGSLDSRLRSRLRHDDFF